MQLTSDSSSSWTMSARFLEQSSGNFVMCRDWGKWPCRGKSGQGEIQGQGKLRLDD